MQHMVKASNAMMDATTATALFGSHKVAKHSYAVSASNTRTAAALLRQFNRDVRRLSHTA